MPVQPLEQEMQRLQSEVLALGRVIEGAIVESVYHWVYREILSFMQGKSRTTIKQARYLARIARNLERTADRVTNICEWVTFAVMGEMVCTEAVDEPINLYEEELV